MKVNIVILSLWTQIFFFIFVRKYMKNIQVICQFFCSSLILSARQTSQGQVNKLKNSFKVLSSFIRDSMPKTNDSQPGDKACSELHVMEGANICQKARTNLSRCEQECLAFVCLVKPSSSLQCKSGANNVREYIFNYNELIITTSGTADTFGWYSQTKTRLLPQWCMNFFTFQKPRRFRIFSSLTPPSQMPSD